MSSDVVGREAELASIRDFLAGVSAGATALVLEGEAGMGKTTLWAAGVAEAEALGLRVLQSRPAESETALSFSGVGDLLDAVLDEALAPLPDPQRRALSRALVLEEDDGPTLDRRAVGVAVLGALRSLAEATPVLVAIDDVQWLDAASSAALGYAARRLRAERIGVLTARRVPLESTLLAELSRSLPSERYTSVQVGPVDLTALHHVVHDHLGVALPRPFSPRCTRRPAGIRSTRSRSFECCSARESRSRQASRCPSLSRCRIWCMGDSSPYQRRVATSY